jgi:hypothetical protein
MGAEKKSVNRHAVMIAASRRSRRNRRAKEQRGVAVLKELAADPPAASLPEVVSTAEATLPLAEAPEASLAEAPSVCAADTNSAQVEGAADEAPDRAVSSPAILENTPDAETDVPRPKELRRGRTWPCEKRVGFDMEICVHSITPYAEIYGLHPRFFDFDKGFSMVPAQGFGAARIASSEELSARRLGCGYQCDEDDDEASEDESSDDDLPDTCEYTLVQC